MSKTLNHPTKPQYHQDWQPTATLEALRARAQLLKEIRLFFDQLGVLEVETPLLSEFTISDPNIAPIKAFVHSKQRDYYLQTSPEFHMKRLLAAGSGSIYQIGKAFRDDEVGRAHNPEFTMIEWYRTEITYLQLIEEMSQLLIRLNTAAPNIISYSELFQNTFAINPHTASTEELKQVAEATIGSLQHLPLTQKSDWLDLLFSHGIQPTLGKGTPTFVIDFPECQCALAKVAPPSEVCSPSEIHSPTPALHIDQPPNIAQRFELFIDGFEVANGYQELTDVEELNRRLSSELLLNPERPLDTRFLSAQAHGLPECAGVALGLDRLMMGLQQHGAIKEVISFDFNRA